MIKAHTNPAAPTPTRRPSEAIMSRRTPRLRINTPAPRITNGARPIYMEFRKPGTKARVSDVRLDLISQRLKQKLRPHLAAHGPATVTNTHVSQVTRYGGCTCRAI